MCGSRFLLVAFMICRLLVGTRACDDDKAENLRNVPRNIVCATNGTQYALFRSKCTLKDMNRRLLPVEDTFKMAPLGCCFLGLRGTLDCPAEYEPVCALEAQSNNRRSFNNKCEMERTACKQNIDWRFHMKGLCKNENGGRQQEAIPCLKIFRPVCAIYSGVKSTFSNECLVNAENIRNKADWRIFSKGVCAEDSVHRIRRSIKASVETNTYDNAHQDLDLAELERQLGKDVAYIHAESRFETEYVSNDNPKAVRKVMNVDSSFKSARVPQAFSLYSAETILSPREILRNPRILSSSPAHTSTPEKIEMMGPSAILSNMKDTFEPTAEIPINLPSNLAQAADQVLNAQKLLPPVEKHMNFLENADDKVKNCIYGKSAICGTLEPGKTFTFDNVCELMLRNIVLNSTWSILHDGKCGECDFHCKDKQFSPICVARRGIKYTLVNQCYLKKHICQKGRNEWTVLHESECASTSHKTPINDKYASMTNGFHFTSNYLAETSTKVMTTPDLTTPSTTTTTATRNIPAPTTS